MAEDRPLTEVERVRLIRAAMDALRSQPEHDEDHSVVFLYPWEMKHAETFRACGWDVITIGGVTVSDPVGRR